MGKKYSLRFKLAAVKDFKELQEKGFVYAVDTSLKITSVRELVKILGISSQTLYKWVKKIEESGL